MTKQRKARKASKGNIVKFPARKAPGGKLGVMSTHFVGVKKTVQRCNDRIDRLLACGRSTKRICELVGCTAGQVATRVTAYNKCGYRRAFANGQTPEARRLESQIMRSRIAALKDDSFAKKEFERLDRLRKAHLAETKKEKEKAKAAKEKLLNNVRRRRTTHA